MATISKISFSGLDTTAKSLTEFNIITSPTVLDVDATTFI